MNSENNPSKASTQTTDEYFAHLTVYVLEQCDGDEDKVAEVLRIIGALRLGNSKAD